MNKMIRKMVAIVAIFAIAFTCAPVAMGTSEADAASAPGMVKTLKMKAGYNYVTLNWSKVSSKNLKGYTIYRGGKVLKHVGAKTVSYKDTKVKASTKYTYFVKAYTTYKQKQYYNSKTKKWQAKKPAAKNWKGKKTRTATVKKYGKASPKLTIKTTAKPKATGGSKKTGSSWSYAMDVDKDSKSIEFGLNKVTANTEVRIYRGSKKIGFLKDTKSTAKDAGLKADTEYTYTVKIYHKGNLAKTKTLKYSTTKAEKTTGGQSSSSSTEGTSDGNNNNGNNDGNANANNNRPKMPFENQDEQLDKFIRAPYGSGLSPELEKQYKQTQLKNLQEQINSDENDAPGRYFQNIRNLKRFDKEKSDASDFVPVKLALAQDLDVDSLLKNPEYVKNKKELDELKMMLGTSDSTSDITTMLPEIAKDGGNISPQVIQAMMMQAVMPNIIDVDSKNGF